jgi:hypothetical protein
VQVACRPEDESKEEESDSPGPYFSRVGIVKNVDDDVGNIESDKDEGEKLVP